MRTPGYTRIRKKMYFLGYTKIHVGYSEIQFKSKPPLTLAVHTVQSIVLHGWRTVVLATA